MRTEYVAVNRQPFAMCARGIIVHVIASVEG